MRSQGDTRAAGKSLEEARERLLHNADKRYDLKTIGKLSGNVCADGTRMDYLHDLTAMNKHRTNAEIAEIYKSRSDKVEGLDPIPDKEGYEADKFSYDLLARDKQTLLENSEKNASLVPANCRKNIDMIDNLFGFAPHMEQGYYERAEKTKE